MLQLIIVFFCYRWYMMQLLVFKDGEEVEEEEDPLIQVLNT